MPEQENPPTPPYLSIELLTRLTQLMGHEFDIERLHHTLQTVQGRAEGDPLAQLALTADELGLKLEPTRLPLSEAVWKATQDIPLVIWSKTEEQFLIVTRASTFKVRLATFSNFDEGNLTISRARLARRLGLKNVHEETEIGLILSQTPTGRASADTENSEEAQKSESSKKCRKNKKTTNKEKEGGTHHPHIPPFRRFIRILQPEYRDIVTLIIFAMFSGILYLALPLAVDQVVTNLAFGAQTKPYVQALVMIAKILTLALVLQAIIIGFQSIAAEIIQRRIFVRAASDLAFRLPRVKASAYDRVRGAELVNRFFDIVTIQKNTAFFLLEGINTIVASLIGMVLLSLYHPLLLVFVGVLIILIVTVTWLLGIGTLRTAIDESLTKYRLVGWFEEIATYPFMFKCAGGYDLAYQRTNMLATQFVKARKKHFNNVFRQVIGLITLSIIATVTLLLLGTWLVLSQQITLGQLVASELIMSGIVASLIKLGKKLETWYDTLAATDKVGHLFDLETESSAGEHPELPQLTSGMQLKARDLTFSYHQNEPLISKKNFEITSGSRTAIFGPQGSGVSSLLDLLFALREPTKGYLEFDGLDARNWQLEHLRSSVQLLRRDEFFEGSIVDNLRLGQNEIPMSEVKSALEKVGLLEELLKLPDGLNLRIHLGGNPLSTSQRTCLLFARALVQKPRLLLIDELFDGLDDATFDRLTHVIFDEQLPWTVVVATRTSKTLHLCEQTINLSRPNQ